MPIKYSRPIIVDYDYYKSLYPIADGDQTRIKENIEKWILTSQDYINSICGGLVYKIYPVWEEKDKNGIITEEERIKASSLQTAICQYVEVCIQTGHFFVDMNGAVQGAQSFNINASSKNADVEKTRQDIIRLLVQSGLYQTMSYGDQESQTINKEYDIKKLVNELSTYFIKVDGSNKITPSSTFDFAESSLQVTGNISGAQGNTKKELSNFKLINCEGSISGDVSFKEIKGQPTENELLKKELDLKANASDLSLYIKYTNLDTRSFTQVGGLVSLKLRPSGNLVLQSDGLGIDMTKVAYAQNGVTQIVFSNWNYDGQMDFRIKLPTAIDKTTGQPLTPTLPGQLVNKNYTDETFAKKDLVNVSDFAMSKAMVNTLKRSLNFNSGDLNYQSDADGGNIFIKMGQRKPVRSGTIDVTNKFQGTSTQNIGNRWYANWKQEIPELSESYKDVVLFLTPSTIPSYVVANNNTQEPTGYAVRFDDGVSNVDTTITLGIGSNLTRIEGKLDSPIIGYYMRTSNYHQLVQFGMYLELSADGSFLSIYGQCSGRDRQIYLNLPNDEGPNNFAPQTYQISYAVYERERRVN